MADPKNPPSGTEQIPLATPNDRAEIRTTEYRVGRDDKAELRTLEDRPGQEKAPVQFVSLDKGEDAEAKLAERFSRMGNPAAPKTQNEQSRTQDAPEQNASQKQGFTVPLPAGIRKAMAFVKRNDRNGDGQLSQNEMDFNRDGVVSSKERMAVQKQTAALNPNSTEMQQVRKSQTVRNIIDKDGDGVVSDRELKRLSDPKNAKELDTLRMAMDQDKVGMDRKGTVNSLAEATKAMEKAGLKLEKGNAAELAMKLGQTLRDAGVIVSLTTVPQPGNVQPQAVASTKQNDQGQGRS